MNRFWRELPLAGALLMAALLLVIDPLLAGAPWWTHREMDFWFALALPLLPWLGVAGLMAWLGHVVASRLAAVLLALAALAAGIIPSVLFTLLLDDVFPSAGSMAHSLNLSLLAAAAALPLSLVVLIRTRLTRNQTRAVGASPESRFSG